ncbi:MAG: repeat-containing protein, partial [Phycisphaerales bacterium]|nr:repeat-containing protein [Phycisphaerales bacterium]
PGADSSMAYDAAGNLHVAYYDAAAKNLKYTLQSPAGAWTAPATIDGSSADVGRNPSLAVDKASHPGVAYFDAANGDLRYAFFDGSAWKTVAVDTKGNVGENPSLAFDAKGVPTISYYKRDGGDLRLATLKNAAKNKWNVATVAKKGDVGQFSSLAIDPATNKPVVAFADATGHVLVTAKGKTTTVETLGGAAADVGLAIGANGLPTVSYYDPATGAIKLAEAGGAKGRTFAATTIATVPAGSDPTPALMIDPVTGLPKVVFYDAAADGVFVAGKPGSGFETQQLQSGGGEGFVAAVQPGNGSISFATIDAGGASPVSVGNTETAPVPPTAVSAVAAADGTVAVTWADAADNETGYLVERSTDGVTFAAVGQTEANLSGFIDATAAEATTYAYRVSATGGSGEANVGTAANGATSVSVTTRPAAPADAVAVAASDAEIDVSWTRRSAAATGYRVERSVTGTDAWAEVAIVGGGADAFADAAVAENTSYSYRVTALFGTLPSAAGIVATAASMPAAPDTLFVTQVSPARLDLAWANRSATATGVELQRSTNGTTWATIATLAADADAYSDTGRTEGTAYYYRVRAVGLVGGDYSATANATTNPAAPSNLTATPATSTTINLAWTDNAGTETAYVAERAAGGGSFATIATLPANAASYSDAAAVEGVTYSYRVRAVIAGQGTSANSAAVTATSLPSAPTNLSAALAANGSQVALTWADHSAGESGFQVQRRAVGSQTWSPLATAAANATAYTDASAAEGKSYEYRVRAANAAGGVSAYATAVTATTVPNAPTGVGVASVSSSALTVSWSNGSTGTVTGYVIERSTGGGAYAPVGTADAEDTSFADTTVSPATAYAYRVRATNAGGQSLASQAASGSTRTLAPTSVAATSVAAAHIGLSWAAVTGATGYRVERSADEGETWATAGQVATTTFDDFAGLTEATGYGYRVVALNAGGDSAASDTAGATTRPAAPSTLAVTAVTAEGVTLTWADHSTGETGYVVERATVGGEFGIVGTVDEDVTTFTDDSAAEGTIYQYRVTAAGVGGASVASDDVAATTLPAAPIDVAAAATSATSVDVTWTDASAHETAFVVEVSTDGGDTFTLAGTTLAGVTTYTVAVEEGTSPTFRVHAAQDEARSVDSAAATANVPPAAPSDASTVSQSTTDITVNWVDHSAHETGFRIERSVAGAGSFVAVGTADADATTFTDTTATEGGAYDYRVAATMGVGRDSGYSDLAGGTARPAAPTNLTATEQAGGIAVGWTNASVNADTFTVERSDDAGDTWAVVGSDVTGTSFADAGTVAGSTYSYRVTAANEGGASETTGPVVATRIPSAPTGLAGVVQPDGTSVSLTWNDVAGETEYRLYRTADAGDTWDAVTTLGVGVTAYTDAGLAENHAYAYRVTAYNAGGESAPGTEAAADTTLVPPTDVAAAPTASDVTVTWQDHSGGEAGYTIERSDDAGDTWASAGTAAANAESFVDENVLDGTAYKYRVVAANGPVLSVASPAVDAVTAIAPLYDFLASAATSSSVVELTWAENSARQTGVQIYRSSDNVTYTQIALVDSGVGGYTDAGLTEATAYYYKAIAVNAVSASGAALVTGTTRPIAPTGPAVSATTIDSVTVGWTNGSTRNTGYVVERSDDAGDNWATVATIADPAVVTVTDTGLTEGTAYLYRVSATSVFGPSAPTAELSASTRPAAPTGVAGTSTAGNVATVTWTDVSGGETGYRVERSADAGDTWTTVAASLAADAASFADAGLTPATEYTYRVTALGVGGDSAAATGTVLTVPAAVSDLAAAPAGPTDVTLTWSDVAGNAS